MVTRTRTQRGGGPSLHARLGRLDWPALGAALDDRGHAVTPPVLTPEECAAMRALEGEDARFRSRIDMARYRFGEGRYGYFAHPLPPVVAALREALYPPLAALANAWAERLGEDARYPPALADFLVRCHAAGQTRPTPLLLRYGAGGYNCLHQDRYGPLLFPLQAVCLLSGPGVDFTGGSFLLVEQRPRQQSRGEAVLPEQGALVLFPSHHRPVRGTRGHYRATVRHGVSTVHSGERMTLGLIFHDAE